MALYKTEAIVLKAEAFGEAHRILTLLTPGRGLVRAVAKGVRRPTSRLAGTLLPFTHARLLLWQGRSLDGISQAEVCRSFRPLREDLARMAGALYACELAGELIPEHEENVPAFRLLLSVLDLLSAGARTDLTLRYLDLHLLQLAGFRPDFGGCPACQGPLTGAGRTFFSPASGGCLCAGCLGHAGHSVQGGAAGVWLSGTALGAARGLLRARPRAVPALRVPPAAAAELAAALEAHLHHVLEKRLKALEFLHSCEFWT